MLNLDHSEALFIAQALNPEATAHLLLILAADEVDGDWEGAAMRQRAHAEAMMTVLRQLDRLQPVFKRLVRYPIIEDLLKELQQPMHAARRPAVMKRLTLDALLELAQAVLTEQGQDSFKLARTRLISTCVSLLSDKCLSMSLRTLRDFRYDQRKAWLLQALEQVNPTYPKLVSDTMLKHRVIPQVKAILEAQDHYIRIRRPKKPKVAKTGAAQ